MHWQGELRRYMSYKKSKIINFPWEFEALLKLPLFFKEEIILIIEETITFLFFMLVDTSTVVI